MRPLLKILSVIACLTGIDAPVSAQLFESGRLLATTGVNQLEGAGGGGLVPWALITGYGTRDAIGGNIHGTYVWLPNFTLGSAGAAIGLYDRVELSYAHETFDTRTTGGKLGLGNGYAFNEDVVGLKLRVFGNAVYDQDSWMPQVAVGAQFKSTDNHAVLHAIGAKSSKGVDMYLAATKLFLEESLLLDATVRLTKANQFGLLGFGGDRNGGYSFEFEGSAAYLISRQIAIGAEVRTKPDNLSFAKEGTAVDVFAAYFLTKNLSTTVAYVGLGDIARQKGQNGVYVSLQAGF
jgi:hypothetical protein